MLKDYQSLLVEKIIANQSYGLFLPCGSGKTLTTLESIKRLKAADRIDSALIIAPLGVIDNDVWQNEVKKFGYDFTFHLVTKDDTGNADIYMLNPEKLLSIKRLPFFDMLIIDESTKFKNHGSQRFKMLKALLKNHNICRRLILSGTPAPKGYINLWSQVYILDEGRRLGKYITHFRDRYFMRSGYKGYDYKLLPQAGDAIISKIEDVVDYYIPKHLLDLAKPVINNIEIKLSRDQKRIYDQYKRDAVTYIDGAKLVSFNHMNLRAKLRQLSSGQCYDNNKGEVVKFFDNKLKALSDLVESLQGNPLLVAYNFNHELDAINTFFKKPFPVVKGGITPSESKAILVKWNKGEVNVLLVQVNARSHGLNLQFGGHTLCWFSPTYDLEIYDQLNARLYGRIGQTEQVTIHHLITKGTMDKVIFQSLVNKADVQKAILTALKIN